MHWLRTIWMQRGLVLLLASSLLPMVMVWPQQAAHAASDSHADRLRSQVRASLDETEYAAFEAALQSAAEAEPRALQDFLQHFVDAYAEHASGPSLATVLGLSSSVDQHIVNELQRRLAHRSGWALAPRPSLSIQAAADRAVASRMAASAAVLAMGPALLVPRVAGVLQWADPVTRVFIRVLSTARPRAP